MNTQQFPLASMSPGIAVLTALLLFVPAVLVYAGLWPVAIVVALLYAGVWATMRPRSFSVGMDGLHLDFPVRSTHVSRQDIAGVQQLTKREFKQRFGTALRIGAGGLWGGFGWLWTSKAGLIDFFIARTDGFVLVERRGGRPLLLTPAEPSRFVAAVRGIMPR